MPNHSEDLGKLILRLTLGGLMLFHGISKIVGGVGGITGMLEGQGLPGVLAYGVYVGEVVAPVLIIIGLFTRISAGVLAFNMLVAVLLAHLGDILTINSHGGWGVELQAFYFFPAIALVLLGPGMYSIDYRRAKRGILGWWRKPKV